MPGETIAKPAGIVKCGLTTEKRCHIGSAWRYLARRRPSRSDRRWETPRTAVFTDRHIGKNRLGHLARVIGRQVPPPSLDPDGHRGTPGADKLAIAAHLVADEDRLVKHHAVDGHRGAPPAGALRRKTAPARSICASSHPLKTSPFGLASAGMAITRTSGNVRGDSACGPVAAAARDVASCDMWLLSCRGNG